MSYKRKEMFFGESLLLIILVFCVVFHVVCLRPVSCVPYVDSVSGLSILDFPFVFSTVYLGIGNSTVNTQHVRKVVRMCLNWHSNKSQP